MAIKDTGQFRQHGGAQKNKHIKEKYVKTISVRQAVTDYQFSISHLSQRTQEKYMEALNEFADWCEGEGVTVGDINSVVIRKFTNSLSNRQHKRDETKKLRTSTVAGFMKCIGVFIRWVHNEEGYEGMITERTANNIKIPREDKTVTSPFTQEEIDRLIRACSNEGTTDRALRDVAIISVLLETGIRSSELCGLTLDNVHIVPGGQGYIKVFGKGRKEREVAIGVQASKALNRYIARVRSAQEYTKETHVFLTRGSRPFTPGTLDGLLKRIEKWSGVEDVHCHRFRHTYAIRFLELGGNPVSLSRSMGHTDFAITETYIRAFNSLTARRSGISILDDMGKGKGK